MALPLLLERGLQCGLLRDQILDCVVALHVRQQERIGRLHLGPLLLGIDPPAGAEAPFPEVLKAK